MRSVLPLVLALLAFAPPAAAQPAFDASRMAEADKLIEDAIARKDIPGAVLLVGRGSGNLYLKAYGSRALQPEREPMTTDTVFDLASLSKPIGCATSVMLLIERGKIDPAEKVATYLPDFGNNGKEEITVAQLLLHHGGLIPDNPLSEYKDGPEAAIRNIYRLKPVSTPGSKFAYSDVGYMVLGLLVRAVDGRSLDQFAKEELFTPLAMKDATYLPPDSLKSRCAPTEQREGRWMRGEVHDPRSYALGGVAGHAGLFATADDVGRYCRMILGGGTLDGKRVLKESTVSLMTRRWQLPDGTGKRTFGFDVDTAYSSARGDRFERGGTFGHTGFTGTMLWIDPKNDCFVVLLANSVHPDGKGKTVALRRQVSTVVAEALLGKAPRSTQPSTLPATQPATRVSQAEPKVLTGIDVLKRDNFKLLDGRKVALVTNHSGLDAEGNRTVDLLAGAKNFQLLKLFSPEHGLFGLLDEKVSDTTDPRTGLKVFSLYGKTQKPSAQMLEGIDTIVFDIQDAGARYYTYVSTMGLCMEAAAEHKIRFVVLDRPNPVTGLIVDGPLADASALDFVAFAPMPVAHGMTVGELARYFNAERGIHCDLAVVDMVGWKRSMWFDQTGLMWVNPSPNLRNPTQAHLYLAIGQIEAANLSVGRGTDQPFETIGAPWIDGRRLATALNDANLPGLRFTPITFTPRSSRFAGKECQGVYILVTDREAVRPVRAGVVIAWHLRDLFGDAFQIDGVNRLLKSAETMERLKTAKDAAEIPAPWEPSLQEFKNVRRKYLAYP